MKNQSFAVVLLFCIFGSGLLYLNSTKEVMEPAETAAQAYEPQLEPTVTNRPDRVLYDPFFHERITTQNGLIFRIVGALLAAITAFWVAVFCLRMHFAREPVRSFASVTRSSDYFLDEMLLEQVLSIRRPQDPEIGERRNALLERLNGPQEMLPGSSQVDAYRPERIIVNPQKGVPLPDRFYITRNSRVMRAATRKDEPRLLHYLRLVPIWDQEDTKYRRRPPKKYVAPDNEEYLVFGELERDKSGTMGWADHQLLPLIDPVTIRFEHRHQKATCLTFPQPQPLTFKKEHGRIVQYGIWVSRLLIPTAVRAALWKVLQLCTDVVLAIMRKALRRCSIVWHITGWRIVGIVEAVREAAHRRNRKLTPRTLRNAGALKRLMLNIPQPCRTVEHWFKKRLYIPAATAEVPLRYTFISGEPHLESPCATEYFQDNEPGRTKLLMHLRGERYMKDEQGKHKLVIGRPCMRCLCALHARAVRDAAAPPVPRSELRVQHTLPGTNDPKPFRHRTRPGILLTKWNPKGVRGGLKPDSGTPPVPPELIAAPELSPVLCPQVPVAGISWRADLNVPGLHYLPDLEAEDEDRAKRARPALTAYAAE